MRARRQFAATDSRGAGKAGILAVATALAFGIGPPPCFGQNSPTKANATVKNDSLLVHSQMDESSQVVRTLKKGDALVLNFQIAGSTGAWCGVALPGQGTQLGYVDCAALDVHQPSSEPQHSASGPGFAGEPGVGEGGGEPQPAIHLSLSSPAASYVAAYNQLKGQVINGDEIDAAKMAAIDIDAKAGTSAAMDRAALAHMVAGSFDFSESNTDEAIDQFNAALDFSTQNPPIRFASLLDLAYVHLVRSEYGPASKYLSRAQSLNPNSAAVAELLGWSDYGLNRLGDAVSQLEKAQRLQPNPEVAALLAKVRRDQQTESDFRQSENSHFILRYEGGATPELAEGILNALEGDYQTLQSALDFTPAQPIAVILYTGETFRDVTRAPSWSGAINDGRIRIPVQGLTSVTPELARELRHELTHSFVRQMTDGRCPTWLNEGLAQWFEGRRSEQTAQALVTLYEKKKYIPLQDLEGSWMSFPTPVAVYAYAWGLAAVESIIANSGMYGIQRLFTRLKEEDSVQTAMGSALQLSYSDLELQTVQYLQKTYLQ